jgi:mono/diheme cytochrome c family protein
VMLRLATIFLLLTTSGGLAQERKASSLEEHGRGLAQRMCSACHGVGRSSESPHVGAPPFRALDRRVGSQSGCAKA